MRVNCPQNEGTGLRRDKLMSLGHIGEETCEIPCRFHGIWGITNSSGQKSTGLHSAPALISFPPKEACLPLQRLRGP